MKRREQNSIAHGEQNGLERELIYLAKLFFYPYFISHLQNMANFVCTSHLVKPFKQIKPM